MAVPEAAVNQDNRLELWQDDVGFAGQVFAMKAVPASHAGSRQLWLANLSTAPKVVRLPVKELAEDFGWTDVRPGQLVDVLGKELYGKTTRPTLRIKGDMVELTLEGSQGAILELSSGKLRDRLHSAGE